ncbi:MAG TPA: ATP-binding protein [Blastocatellia bacterium]|nr:ATP-binding protein [Blastocatellia bacterium]
MTPLQIIQLVGFTTGAILHLYIAWLIMRRRNLIHAEKSLVLLGATLGAWFLGSLINLLYHFLGLRDLTGILYVGDTLAFAGVGLLPTALLHVHFAFWGMWDDSPKRRYYWVGIILSYVPLIVVPVALDRLFLGPYQTPLVKLAPWIVPHATWTAISLLISAGIDARLSTQVRQPREQRFYYVLAITLALIGLGFFVVYVLNARAIPVIGHYLDTAIGLSALLPTAICAYYIYRYGFLELIIKQSFVYAGFAALVVVVYVYGVRTIDDFLVQRYKLTPHVIETILTLALVFVAQPVMRWLNSSIKRLFAREVNVYRNLVLQVTRQAAAFGDIESLIEFLQATVRRELDLPDVKIVTKQQAEHQASLAEVFKAAEDYHLTFIDDETLLKGTNASVAYPLWRERKLVGLMLLRAATLQLDSERRAILAVLSGQIAITLANCQLTEEKVQLERELAQRERLAVLGQMAATVAHEVKNPLSAIKSIAQVMSEDPAINQEYERDIALILGEINRLNRTVTQMLSFSRPYRFDTEDIPVTKMVEHSAKLCAAEAQSADVELKTNVKDDLVLSGGQGGPLTEVLSNLMLNAIQASPKGGLVSVEARATQNNGHKDIEISVTDTGPGIPNDLRAKIFEPFFTTKQRGTGLGLAIVQRRVAEIGGSLELESPVSDTGGTRFNVIFPMVEPARKIAHADA